MLVQTVKVCDNHTNEVIWVLKVQIVMPVTYPELLQISKKELNATIITP